jgi:hypothetical protein
MRSFKPPSASIRKQYEQTGSSLANRFLSFSCAQSALLQPNSHHEPQQHKQDAQVNIGKQEFEGTPVGFFAAMDLFPLLGQ